MFAQNHMIAGRWRQCQFSRTRMRIQNDANQIGNGRFVSARACDVSFLSAAIYEPAIQMHWAFDCFMKCAWI